MLGRWPRPKHSSDRAVTGNALRCCSHISSASCGLAACDCAGRAVPSSSSRWRRSPRTCAGSLSSSPGHHRWPPQGWRERQVALALRRQRRRFKAIASTERVATRLQFGAKVQFASPIGDFCNKICQNLTLHRSKCVAISTALARADRNRGIVARAGNSARPSTGAGRRQCAGTAVPPAFLCDTRAAHLFSPIFDLESTRAGADGTQARARLSHSKRP